MNLEDTRHGALKSHWLETVALLDKALDKHEKELNIAGKAGDRAAEGDAYLNLGIAYNSHSDFPKAIECYERSLNLAREAGDGHRVADAYLTLGIAYDSHSKSYRVL